MTTLGHGLLLAAVTGNAYLQLAVTLVLVGAGFAVLALGIGLLLNVTVPLVFDDELRALKALVPQVG